MDFNINIRRREPRISWVRSLKKCIWDQVRESLATAPWSVMEMYDDINDKWEFFHGVLFHTIQSFAPLKKFILRSLKGPLRGFVTLFWKRSNLRIRLSGLPNNLGTLLILNSTSNVKIILNQ